jgi:hypothetical protein
MTPVTESTSIERLKTDRAGVATGEKMLVEDWEYAGPAKSNMLQTAHRPSEVAPKPRFMTEMVIGSSAVEAWEFDEPLPLCSETWNLDD